MKLKLSDDVIAAIARTVQLGILTGTDVVDHLRLLELEATPESEFLELSVECVARTERNVKDMLDRATELSELAASAAGEN